MGPYVFTGLRGVAALWELGPLFIHKFGSTISGEIRAVWLWKTVFNKFLVFFSLFKLCLKNEIWKTIIIIYKKNICLIVLVKQFNRTNKIKNIFKSCFFN